MPFLFNRVRRKEDRAEIIVGPNIASWHSGNEQTFDNDFTVQAGATSLYVVQQYDGPSGWEELQELSYAGVNISLTQIVTSTTNQPMRIYKLTNPTPGTNKLYASYVDAYNNLHLMAFTIHGNTSESNFSTVGASSGEAVSDTIASDTGHLVLSVLALNVSVGADHFVAHDHNLAFVASTWTESAAFAVGVADGAASVTAGFTWTGTERHNMITFDAF